MTKRYFVRVNDGDVIVQKMVHSGPVQGMRGFIEVTEQIYETVSNDAEFVYDNEAMEVVRRGRVTPYRVARSEEYPAIGDQLDALWKGGQELLDMQARILAVKEKHPKPSP